MKIKKSLWVALLLVFLPCVASAQPNATEGASAVFEEFLSALTDTDIDRVLELFTPDALFWGTGSQSLVRDHAGIRQYFSAIGDNPPGENIARARDYAVAVLSEDLVLISGMWEVVPRDESIDTPLRVSMALALRDGQWKIIQFHNSTVPQ